MGQFENNHIIFRNVDFSFKIRKKILKEIKIFNEIFKDISFVKISNFKFN